MKPAAWTSSDVLLLIALIALALNLRSPFTAVAPIVGEIQAELQINKTVAGLLTSIPVLCFGLLAPVASRCIARTSVETSILISLSGVLAGIMLRSAGGVSLALAGTFLIGASITIGNIVSLVLIARDFPARAAAVMGLYTSALNVGPMLTAALSEPLAKAIGWRWALVSWGLLAIAALVLWWRVIVRRRIARSVLDPQATAALQNATPPVASATHVLRRPVVWLLVAGFAAHLFIYYGLAAWLPEYLQQAARMSPTRAGLATAFFQLFALAGTLGVPALSATGRFARSTLLLVIAIAWLATTLGLLLAPALWPAWCMTGGFASGGGITVIFMLAMAAANGLDENRNISAAVQGLGYLIAASGPVAVGGIAEWTGSWGGGFALMTACGIMLAVVAQALARVVNA
ncbi:putative transporter YycB [Caulifigura coniformis]|uniref:Putative transporter YycB n=1 Tax=Caulifigura coniformis TaxID=2527983 RepID=A0A517SCH2_9PLAN|nr:MFS transporter [Caulifigura coniformis]QDT53814.1 putative transporter YycB [Caulifigura coniformis]